MKIILDAALTHLAAGISIKKEKTKIAKSFMEGKQVILSTQAEQERSIQRLQNHSRGKYNIYLHHRRNRKGLCNS